MQMNTKPKSNGQIPRMSRAGEAGAAPTPALSSAALAVAGRCVAMSSRGIVPTGAALRLGADGKQHPHVDGLPQGSRLTTELVLAGAVARGLHDDDEDFDRQAIVEMGLAMIVLQSNFNTALLAAGNLIEQHMVVTRAIAGRLVVKLSLSGEELAAHLAPVIAPAGRRA